MASPADPYTQHPMTHEDRRRAQSTSPWVRSFRCTDVRPLIVCRGPIRKEAMDVFEQMGIDHYGILLSEKDSIVYPQALAPELRAMRPEHVHRVQDYTGASKTERELRMRQIVQICAEGGYTHVFAGYGFMAEDEQFVRALEEAGLVFIGPRSSVQAAAGRKDEAKRTALKEKVSVTPGIDDATARTLLAQHPDHAALREVIAAHGLRVAAADVADAVPLRAAAEAVLEASYRARIDLFTLEPYTAEVARCAAQLFLDNPGFRVRLKAIGGGGGKGQRLLAGIAKGQGRPEAEAAAALAPVAVREILAEVKAGGEGDNKNVLLELNIEETRHNEIQLLGNGRWCVALGGRDCSLQMHEQKLLEVSITYEGLQRAVLEAEMAGRSVAAEVLAKDLATLARMEAEAERFGLAVGLDSASTFECIVSGEHHFFMEVNTRIQVEHRVTELCYALRFANPDDADDHFVVNSLVEAMVLVARHGARLPRPERVVRQGAALEARLNATDRSLSPHAGGVIHGWTDAIEHEIRDDQGISARNPDTGAFVHYRLAGAYDSNIALLVTYGADRRASYERLSDVLRRAKLRGEDLQTNLAFHYGLLHWFVARGVWAKPTTRFVVPYLSLVGLLHEATEDIDLFYAWARIGAHRAAQIEAQGGGEKGKLALLATRRALQLKETLFKRPLDALFDDPHVLSAWLSHNLHRWNIVDGRVVWLENPLFILRDTYNLMNMDWRSDVPAAHVIWDHDRDLLDAGLSFYRDLADRLGGLRGWADLQALLAQPSPPAGFDAGLWESVRGAHVGFQSGLELLDVLPLVAERVGFGDLRVEDDLTIPIPPRLADPALAARMKKVLVPPPATKEDEIVAASGGMFYAQEAPDRPPFLQKGSHFQKGDPLYIIEVMKMFNRVHATFSGTVDEVLIDGNGTIVAKGQPLYKVTPDEKLVPVDPKARAKARKANTDAYLAQILA